MIKRTINTNINGFVHWNVTKETTSRIAIYKLASCLQISSEK